MLSLQIVKASIHRERALSTAHNKIQEKPNWLWMAVLVLLNILIFVGISYLLWELG